MIVVAIAAGLIGYVIGKPASPQAQDKATDASEKPTQPEKPTEPKEPAFLKEGLVAYYPFNGNAKDESGNGNDGLAANVKYVSGGFGLGGKTAKFENGSSITANAQNLPLGNTPRTMSCFVKVTGATPGTETHIAAWGSYGQNNRMFAFFGDTFDVSPDGNGFLAWSQWGKTVDFTGPTEATRETLYHLAATFDGSTLTTYLNGTKVNSAAYQLNTGAGDLLIGHRSNYRTLQGSIDELRIYNRALSEEQVQALYDWEKPKE